MAGGPASGVSTFPLSRTRPELTDFCGRMARALLYEQHKVRTDAKTKFKWGFADFMHPDDIVYLTSIKPPRVYGDEVFSYCVHVNPLNLVAICWVQFYKQVEIVTVVALNEVIRDEEDPSEMAERLKLSYKYDTTFPGWKSLPTLKKAVFIEKTLGA